MSVMSIPLFRILSNFVSFHVLFLDLGAFNEMVLIGHLSAHLGAVHWVGGVHLGGN